MRVLHVMPSLDERSGGPLRAVLDLSAHSEQCGLDSEVVGTGSFSVKDNPLDPRRIHAMERVAIAGYAYSPKLRPWLRENVGRFNGVIIHGLWLYPGWAAHRECLHQGTPYALFPHGMLEPWAVHRQGWLKKLKKTAYWHLFEKKVHDNATFCLYTTEREKELASCVFGSSDESYVVAPYGVRSTVEDYPDCHPDFAGELSDRPFALFLSRVHPKKNVEFLLRAWAKASTSNWRLVIAGPAEPRYARELVALARSLRISDAVVFLDFVAGGRKAWLLRNAKWFLLPSRQENFGIAVLEAVRAGCPAAISDQVFLSEKFQYPCEVLPLQEQSWVEFLQRRMGDEEWRRRVVENDELVLLPQFEMETVARLWSETLMSAFGFRGSEGRSQKNES